VELLPFLEIDIEGYVSTPLVDLRIRYSRKIDEAFVTIDFPQVLEAAESYACRAHRLRE